MVSFFNLRSKIKMEFKDYFSEQSSDYAKYRPGYPDELFAYLSSITNEHHRAWDCAAGNGQAALSLAHHFDEVIATDASEKQIQNAKSHPKIKYKVVPAENSGIESDSVDLITVATAIHWLNLEKFYQEARRTLKPGGTLAIWNYSRSNVNEAVDRVTDYYMEEIVGSYAAPDFWRGVNAETDIDFPFERIKTPEFKIRQNWSFKEYVNYIMTWSPTRNYIKKKNSNPLELIFDEFKNAWGDENEEKEIIWKLTLKAAKVK
jgi:ubiquinone/menaquinone biosynthesis C-methylase UbiE